MMHLFIITLTGLLFYSKTAKGFDGVLQSYYEIGSCTCDLTQFKCDIGCCCDEDCKKYRTLPFQCINNSSVDLPPTKQFPGLDCAYISSLSTEYSPFLCIQSMHSAFLGRFYKNPELALTYKQFESIVNDYRSISLPVSKPYSSLIQPGDEGYKYGSVIQTTDSSGNINVASLPTTFSTSGSCVFGSPVKYLRDSRTECVFTGSVDQCGADNQKLSIDPQLYRFPPASGILQSPGSQDVVPVNITYMCQRNTNEIVDCGFGPGTYPHLSSSSGLCRNSVLSAQWFFIWNSTRLVNLDMMLILGNVRPPIAQDFVVKYTHIDGAGVHVKSGIVGYNLQAPLLALSKLSNPPQISQLYFWNLGETDICNDVKRTPVVFGEDVSSGCLWPVTDKEFEDCNVIRDKVYKEQFKLFNAKFISTNGNVTSLGDVNSTHYVPILTENQRYINGSNAYTLLKDGNGRCSNVAHHVHLQVLFSDMGTFKGQPVYQVAGARVVFTYGIWEQSHSYTGQSSFPVMSSVTFSRIPAIRKSKKKRFWTGRHDCAQDICWQELWYPTLNFKSFQEMLTSTIICLLFIIPCLLVYINQYLLIRI